MSGKRIILFMNLELLPEDRSTLNGKLIQINIVIRAWILLTKNQAYLKY
jgi:hypothetical protein